MTDIIDPTTEAGLAGLREPAPPGLAHATLVAVGLADDYAVIDSPVGPLRVAWNGRGVSEVSGADGDHAFEARFHARTGRTARRRDALPEALARKTIDASTSQPAVLFDFGLDRVTSHHYFVRLGIVPRAVVMTRKKFESLPKAGQDAILKYDMDYINKLYIASMLEYDASLVK